MNASELRELLMRPESDALEFKLSLPDPATVSRLVASLANARGGNLVVGAGEHGRVVGLREPADARRILQDAAGRVSPSVAVSSEVVDLDGKPVLVATIARGESPPYFVDGRAFQRVGARTVPIRSDTVYESVRERATDLNAVLQEVRRLADVIEALNEQLIAAGGWRRRATDWVLGGIVGAAISIMLTRVSGVP